MAELPRSPLAPQTLPALGAVAGVRFASGGFGLRYHGRPDVLLAICDEGTVTAGVTTVSSTAAAPSSAVCRRPKNDEAATSPVPLAF